MHFLQEFFFATFTVTSFVKAGDIAREVESGVQLLKTGPVQLIVPDILSFTIKNQTGCRGNLRICYVYTPTITRDQLREYQNVGPNCPSDSCTLVMAMTGGVSGLGSEQHDGNFYGILPEGSGVMCPRHIVDGRSNFTVLELPNCPVIVDGAVLPKDEETEPKIAKSTLWVIPVCVGFVLFVLGIVIVGVYFCLQSKRKPVQPANSLREGQQILKPTKSKLSHHKTTSASKRSEPSFVASASPKTRTTNKFHSPTTNDDD